MKNKVNEYKDAAGEWRINDTAANGNILIGVTEGYKNRSEARHAMIQGAKDVLDHYAVSIPEVVQVAAERQLQILEHGYTTEHDVVHNGNGQLVEMAALLVHPDPEELIDTENGEMWEDIAPLGWPVEAVKRLAGKPYIERLTIAGAWIIAEMQRLNKLSKDG